MPGGLMPYCFALPCCPPSASLLPDLRAQVHAPKKTTDREWESGSFDTAGLGATGLAGWLGLLAWQAG